MPRPFYPQGKSPWWPLDRRLGGLQSRSGRGGESILTTTTVIVVGITANLTDIRTDNTNAMTLFSFFMTCETSEKETIRTKSLGIRSSDVLCDRYTKRQSVNFW